MKWKSKNTYVDRETGEEINGKLLNTGEYIKIKCTTKTTYDEISNTRTRHHTWECERSRQTSLW